MNNQKKHYRIALLLLGFCSLLFVVRGFVSETRALHSRDFKPVYAAARCMLADCNPYDTAETKQEYLRAGGKMDDEVPFRRFNETYPPSTFFLMLPIAWLPWSVADAAWLGLIAATMITAAFLMADLCAPYMALPAIAGMGLSLLTATILMMLGQPAGVAIGCGMIGAWCLLKCKYEAAGVVCFAISLVCKPQIAALIWAYFFLAGPHYRKRALQIAGLTILLCVPGILWVSFMPASAHWVRDLHANLAFNVARGGPADPGPADRDAPVFANLQGFVSVFRDDPGVYDPIVWAIMGPLILAWFYLTVRVKSSIEKDLIALASAVCFTLLPVYHRNYDGYIFLLSFPALALLFRRRWLLGAIAFALSLLVIIFISSTYIHFIQVHYFNGSAPMSLVRTLALARNMPIALLVLGTFYLVQLFRLREISEGEIRTPANVLVS